MESIASERTRSAVKHLVSLDNLARSMTDSYPNWMQENAAVHIVWAKMMANCGIHTLFSILQGVEEGEFADALSAASAKMPHWQTVLELSRLYTDGKDAEVVAKAEDALQKLGSIKSSSIGNAQLTWKILMALSYVRLLRGDDAFFLLREVARNFYGPDGGVCVAVAERLISELKL